MIHRIVGLVTRIKRAGHTIRQARSPRRDTASRLHALLCTVTELTVIAERIIRCMSHRISRFIAGIHRAGDAVVQTRHRTRFAATAQITDLGPITEEPIITQTVLRRMSHRIRSLIAKVLGTGHSVVHRNGRTRLAGASVRVAALHTVAELIVVTPLEGASTHSLAIANVIQRALVRIVTSHPGRLGLERTETSRRLTDVLVTRVGGRIRRAGHQRNRVDNTLQPGQTVGACTLQCAIAKISVLLCGAVCVRGAVTGVRESPNTGARLTGVIIRTGAAIVASAGVVGEGTANCCITRVIRTNITVLALRIIPGMRDRICRLVAGVDRTRKAITHGLRLACRTNTGQGVAGFLTVTEGAIITDLDRTHTLTRHITGIAGCTETAVRARLAHRLSRNSTDAGSGYAFVLKTGCVVR
jgi:hypothetical protein